MKTLSQLSLVIFGLLFSCSAWSQVQFYNAANSGHQFTFNDQNSFAGSLQGGLYPASAFPWNGALTTFSQTDPTTNDSANGDISAGISGINYYYTINNIKLTQATGNTGFASLNLQFLLEYRIGPAGYTAPTIYPNFLIAGTVKTGGTGASISGFVNYYQNFASAGNLLDTVNYNWSTTTPGAFSGVPLNGVPTSNLVSLTPGSLLLINGNLQFNVDPSTLQVTSTPEPTMLLPIALSGLLCRRKRRALR